MKARIKATGEIIKIADYATIALDDHDSWGNPIEMKPEDIELIQEVSEDELKDMLADSLAELLDAISQNR